MIIAAVLCPWPPVLARELTGRDPAVPDLRRACTEAVQRLVQAGPELIAVVGPSGSGGSPGSAATATRVWDPDSHMDLSVFAPALGTTGNPALPPSLGIGTLLLDQAGYQGPRSLHAVAEKESAATCAELGVAISRSAERVGLLAMGDGSARRSPRAPGHLDERAATFDAETEQALRQGDLDALLAISPALARELMATGRPAWQVLAGAMSPVTPATDVLYSDDPFGVAYVVAFLEPRS